MHVAVPFTAMHYCLMFLHDCHYSFICCSHLYGSSLPYSGHTGSSHPLDANGPSSFHSRMPYTIASCGPLWCIPDLIVGLHQRGVAQEKWSCVRPRSCLTYGLSLVLPLLQSVYCPSSHDDVIQGPDGSQTWKLAFSSSFQKIPPFPPHFQVGSMWNLPDNYHLPYGG